MKVIFQKRNQHIITFIATLPNDTINILSAYILNSKKRQTSMVRQSAQFSYHLTVDFPSLLQLFISSIILKSFIHFSSNILNKFFTSYFVKSFFYDLRNTSTYLIYVHLQIQNKQLVFLISQLNCQHQYKRNHTKASSPFTHQRSYALQNTTLLESFSNLCTSNIHGP